MAKSLYREEILHGSLGKAFAVLAVPIIANSFIQTMYNLADTYWLGKMGESNQAAITLVSPIQSIIMNFGSGIVAAGSILIAQYLGAKKDEEAKTMASHIYVCSLLFSIICASLCFMLTPNIVRWLGAENLVETYAVRYLRIVILDMPFLFMINVFQSVNQSQGNTVRPMLLNLTGVILNMILDPLLMFGFHMGIGGAALATLGAKIPCAILAVISLNSKKNPIYVSLKGFHFQSNMLKSIVKIGLPTALGSSTMQFGFLLMAKSVVKYQTAATAAYGIGNKINGLITLPSNACGSATATIVGLNMGASQTERVQKAYRLSRNVSVAFLLIGGIILSRPIISTAMVRIFTNSEEVTVLTAQFLSILALYCFTNGIYNSTMGLFQGTGHTMVTMAVDATRLWVFRFATLFVCEQLLHMGVKSIWYSIVVSNALSALVLYILYQTKIWKNSTIHIS